MNRNWRLQCFVPGCFPFDFESSSAINIRKFVESKLAEYKLKLNETIYVVTDNESKMVTTFKSGSRRIGCSVHYINKQLEHAFNKKEIDKLPVTCDVAQEIFDRIKKIVAYVRRSHKQAKMSKRVQAYSETRFNGAYHMIRIFADVFDELSMVLDSSHLQELLSIDKDLLNQICSFLKVFDHVIEQLSDDKKPTIYKVLPLRQLLLNECEVRTDDHNGVKQIKVFLCKWKCFSLKS